MACANYMLTPIKIDTLINKSLENEKTEDIDRLVELLNMCSTKQRHFVTDISKEIIIKLMGDKIIE